VPGSTVYPQQNFDKARQTKNQHKSPASCASTPTGAAIDRVLRKVRGRGLRRLNLESRTHPASLTFCALALPYLSSSPYPRLLDICAERMPCLVSKGLWNVRVCGLLERASHSATASATARCACGSREREHWPSGGTARLPTGYANSRNRVARPARSAAKHATWRRGLGLRPVPPPRSPPHCRSAAHPDAQCSRSARAPPSRLPRYAAAHPPSGGPLSPAASPRRLSHRWSQTWTPFSAMRTRAGAYTRPLLSST
jgi:hypothetical protein